MLTSLNKKRLNIWGILLPFMAFTKEIGMVEIGGIQFDMIGYPFFLIAFFVFFLTRKLSFSKNELIVFSLIFISGIIVDILLNLPMSRLFKQFTPIFIMYFVAKVILIKNNPILVFEQYVKYAVIAAIIGIIQFLLKFIGILFLTGYSGYFIDSVALEPSHYVIMMLPSVLYFYLKKEFSWKFWLILTTILLTLKLTAFLSLGLFYIIINYRKIFKFILSGIIVITIGFYIVETVPEFADRIMPVLVYFKSGKLEDVNNMTTFSFISNAEIAYDNFINTYGLGVGLGGHETTYIRNFNTPIYSDDWYGLNYKSAHALPIRIFSELGILGIYIFYMVFYKSLKIRSEIFKIIALSSLGHFIAKIFKLGSYFDYGSIFFLVTIIMMIILDKKERKKLYKGFNI